MRKMKKLVALILAFVALGCWGVSIAGADELGFYAQGGVNLNGPSYDWWYGCSPTSAGMMMGHYDQKGYGGLSYSNLVPGGVAESSTFPSTAGIYQYLAQYTIASPEHMAQFYLDGYLASHDDRGPTHTFNCLADFMGTSQDAEGNVNGGTTFWYNPNGAKIYAKDVYNAGHLNDGMLGMDEYFRYAGYALGLITDDRTFFTQLIQGKGTDPGLGYTFADYKALIDAGLVAMIHVYGHSMFGYGYDDNGNIIFRDTWDGEEHTMAWGGTYAGMAQWGVTVFTPTGGSPVPLPSTLLLMVSGLAGLAGLRRRFGKR
jgi:hypothetical protein